MVDDRDELDASDWLASQFGEGPGPKPEEPGPAGEPAPPIAPPPVAPPTVAPPSEVQAPPAHQPPPFSPPSLVAPPQPDLPQPTVPVPAPQQPAPAQPPTADAPFQWGLTPGAPVTPEPALPAQPAPPHTEYPASTPPVFEPPTVAYVPPQEQPPTTILPPVELPAPSGPRGDDTTQWFAAPVDPALDGVTEVFEAELVGAAPPVDEGPAASAIDSLFGDNQFRDFSGEPLIPAPPPRGPAGPIGAKARPERAPLPRTQKILMWVAGSLVALLALLALFLLGTRLSAVLGPAPAAAPTPSATPSPSAAAVPAIGPVAPGEHQWDDLLGGECITPFESAWEDRYTVVECTTPHKAQMVYRGTFPDALTVEYPGLEELQKRINLLCTAPTIIDYAAAGVAQDIQVSASFAVDSEDWDEGNRTYYCFVNRAGGEDLSVSVAVPQVAPAPTPLPTP